MASLGPMHGHPHNFMASMLLSYDHSTISLCRPKPSQNCDNDDEHDDEYAVLTLNVRPKPENLPGLVLGKQTF